MKKQLALILAAVMLAGSVAGCSIGGKTDDADGRVKVTIGGWPDKDANPSWYESKEAQAAEFNEKNPDIHLSGDTYSYDVQSFMAKAEGKTLPTMYSAFMTEAKKIFELGYASPITEQMKQYGYYDNINDYILEKIAFDGEVYYIPNSMYSMGIAINLDVYEKAGFVSEDGTPYAPETFEDLARVAKEIKEKTGVAGFAMPTAENVGGWCFMPMAWGYGVEFEKTENGKTVSNFNTPECVEAFELLKKMKWEDNSLPENTFINANEAVKMVATGQAAMTFAHPGQVNVFKSFGLDIDSLGMVKMPAGTKSRVTLVGGNLDVIRSDATEEQKNAIFKWLDFLGSTYKVSEENKVNIEEGYKNKNEAGNLVGIKDLSIWKDSAEISQFTDEMLEKYRNINPNHVASYNDKDGIEYRIEEAVCTQDLYKLLDGCIQEILTNKDADCAKLIETASQTFQSNFLDKE